MNRRRVLSHRTSLIGNLRPNPLCCGGSRQTACGKSVRHDCWNNAFDRRKLETQAAWRRCRFVCGGGGKRAGMGHRIVPIPALDRSPVSVRRRTCRLTRRRRNCAGSREVAMDPGQPFRSRKKKPVKPARVFGVFKFARRAPQTPMSAFAGASAAPVARSWRRLVLTVQGGFAGQSRRSPLGPSDPTRVLSFPLP